MKAYKNFPQFYRLLPTISPDFSSLTQQVNNKDNRVNYKVNNKFFIVCFEYISHIVLVFPLLTLDKQIPAG